MALALRAAAALVAPDPRPYRPDAQLLAYHEEMLAPFGLRPDEERLRISPNLGFPQLTEAVLGALPLPVSSPDMLLLAYGLPDMYPLKSTTAHLNHLMGGGSRSFAVAEQGLRAPFTALKIADAYAQSGRYATLALFVCDQTTLPYHDPLVHDTPLRDSAVLLYFDSSAGGYTFHGTAPTAAGEGADAAVKPFLSDVDTDRTLVVAGPWVALEPLAALAPHIHQVGPGSYCTSVWLDLARHHEAWTAAYDAVVLSDTDPRTGRSQAALLRLEPS
jgi:hypothetical protein